jgi:hypothetical protein
MRDDDLARDDDLVLADGTRMKRMPADEDGNPTGPFDERILAADLGGPPKVVRIGPKARLVTVLDSTGDSPRRAIVAFPPFRVFPSRDGIDLPGEGHWRFDALPRQVPRSAYAKRIPREVDPKDLLWEVVIVSDI